MTVQAPYPLSDVHEEEDVGQVAVIRVVDVCNYSGRAVLGCVGVLVNVAYGADHERVGHLERQTVRGSGGESGRAAANLDGTLENLTSLVTALFWMIAIIQSLHCRQEVSATLTAVTGLSLR